MDLTGPYPKLTDADSVYAIKEYSELMAAKVAAAAAKLPQGIVKRNNRTTSTPAFSALTIVQNQKDILFVAGRAYRIAWNVNFYLFSTSDTYAFGISLANNGDADTSTANMTPLRSVSDRVSAAQEGRNKVVEVMYYPTATETLQIKAWMQRVVGTNGNAVASADPSNANQLTIYDFGVDPG